MDAVTVEPNPAFGQFKWVRWYFAPRRSGDGVIGWWERRRGAYNLVLLAWLLLIAVVYALVAGSYVVLETILVFLLVFQLPANLWYTGGWMIELAVRLIFKKDFPRFGPVAIIAGTVFSILFAGVISGWVIYAGWRGIRM